MKILVVESSFNLVNEMVVPFIPRIGDAIDLFYSPFPIVTSVLIITNPTTLEQFGIKSNAIAAVVYVSSQT